MIFDYVFFPLMIVLYYLPVCYFITGSMEFSQLLLWKTMDVYESIL